ncbi:GDSL-type esterase/lipase family protein [Chitinibacter tainanensis]|uniref:GDSL-type esterase/lipase family protein n=1 Tax=Chitinibacter tainanensis TaxID=230667 RepID=UPI0023572AC8|nr:GDSL-type esterase/lipase family protein [Chitinibacter tainanensis]
MRQWRIWLVASLIMLGLSLSGCGGPKLPAVPAGAVVLAFGDSLTYGTGATADTSYPARLAAQTGWQIVNAGVPGETAAQGAARLAATLDEVQPKLVLLCLGGNDFLQRLPVAQTQSALREMLALLQARQIPVLLIGVPKLGLGLDTHPLYAELAKEYQVPLNDTLLEDLLAQASLKSDTVHPNAAGYQRMADELARQLQQLGAR